MTKFVYKIWLVDAFGKTSPLTYDLGDFTEADAGADFLAAQTAANQIRGALVDITDAFVKKETLTSPLSDDNQVPTGEIFISEEALIFTHLNAPTEAEKPYRLRVPAPTQSEVFLADGKTVDPLNALVVQYVQQVAQHAYVSDGEQINTASGPYSNGIADPAGYLRTVSRKYKD